LKICAGWFRHLSDCRQEGPGEGRKIFDLVIDDYRPTVIIVQETDYGDHHDAPFGLESVCSFVNLMLLPVA
jgi:hypothetical protein